MNDLITKKQLAERWQCSPHTIDRMRRKNIITAINITGQSGGLVRFALDDILEYEKRRKDCAGNTP